MVVSYLAIARAASKSLDEALSSSEKAHSRQYPDTKFLLHHNHDCTLRDLEERGVRRVLVCLRHPLSRISSGVSRRLEGNRRGKDANALFLRSFAETGDGGGGAEAYVGALRNASDPLHGVALGVTLGRRRQSYMLPVSEFYLARSSGAAEVAFLCIDSLREDYAAALRRWFPRDDESSPLGRPSDKRQHVSRVSSGNATMVFSRFSEESVDWIERTYANDIGLYKKHCPGGYRKYADRAAGFPLGGMTTGND